jgi:hypothetical protein
LYINYKNKKEPLYRGFFCAKKHVLALFLFTSIFLFSQEKLIKTREVKVDEIEIITDGLDDVIIENSKSNVIEVILLDENPNTHTVLLKEEVGALKVEFKLNFNTPNQQVFRKYITKRLQRAKAIIKIPMHKNVVLHGKTIGVTSKNYNGNLNIYIDKGNVILNEVKGNTLVKLFLGNVYAQLKGSSNINIETNKGEVLINKISNKKGLYKKADKKATYNFNVRSINANVFLITE